MKKLFLVISFLMIISLVISCESKSNAIEESFEYDEIVLKEHFSDEFLNYIYVESINSNKETIMIQNHYHKIINDKIDINKKYIVTGLKKGIKLENQKKLIFDYGIKLDDLKFFENNPNIEKLIFLNNNDYASSIIPDKFKNNIYVVDDNYSEKVFNLSKKDYEYLNPNLIYLYPNGYVYYADDIDDGYIETIADPILDDKFEFEGWFMNKECTIPLENKKIIKDIQLNTENEDIYYYNPTIIYMKVKEL